MTEGPQVVLLCFWEQTLYHEVQENRLQFQGQVLRWSTKHWQMQQLK